MLLRELSVVVPRQGVFSRGFLVELPLKHLAVSAFEIISERVPSQKVAIAVKDFVASQFPARRQRIRHRAARTVYGHRYEHGPVVAAVRVSNGEVVKARHGADRGVDEGFPFNFIELQNAADFIHARLDGVFSPARARFAFSENITPLLQHFAATGAALLVLVP